MKYLFYVDGTEEVPYRLELTLNDGVVSMTCSCMGARNKRICKHRLGLLSGKVDGLLIDQSSDVLLVQDIVSGSAVEILYRDFIEKESDILNLKKELASLKRQLVREMEE